MTSHDFFFISKRPNDGNELLQFSDSFINNETQSNEILNIIKVASSIFFTSVFRDNTGFYPKYIVKEQGYCCFFVGTCRLLGHCRIYVTIVSQPSPVF